MAQTQLVSNNSRKCYGRTYDKKVRMHFDPEYMCTLQSPYDASILARSMKTLHVRMQRHCENAQKCAEFLESHPKVEKVHYPGLKSHPGRLTKH